MRFGLKMLLYRAGKDACFLCGDLVLPTSNALPLLGEGSFTVLCFRRDAAAGSRSGYSLSGSNAAPGNFNEGGGRPLSEPVPFTYGGLPTMLP